jgi:hypothetical protein
LSTLSEGGVGAVPLAFESPRHSFDENLNSVFSHWPQRDAVRDGGGGPAEDHADGSVLNLDRTLTSDMVVLQRSAGIRPVEPSTPRS